jgi:hypothetical protein
MTGPKPVRTFDVGDIVIAKTLDPETSVIVDRAATILEVPGATEFDVLSPYENYRVLCYYLHSEGWISMSRRLPGDALEAAPYPKGSRVAISLHWSSTIGDVIAVKIVDGVIKYDIEIYLGDPTIFTCSALRLQADIVKRPAKRPLTNAQGFDSPIKKARTSEPFSLPIRPK